MFTRLTQWLREVLKRMIGRNSVKQALQVDVALSTEMANALDLWGRMYTNTAPWLDKDIISLGLPAAIAGEIARATTIEMEVEITGGPRAEFLTDQLAPVLDRLREMIEKGNAKGGLIMKPFVQGAALAVDFVQADQAYPVAFDSSGHITACVFADQRQIGDDTFIRLEYHALTDTGYEVYNRAFKSTGQHTLGSEIPLATVDAWKDLAPEATITGITKPLFAYYRYPLANNVDEDSPLGVSCFSRAAGLIEQADKQWSRLVWEFESGERAIYVDDTAFALDADDKPMLPNKRLYRGIKGSANIGDGELFKDWTPEFREAALLSGLDAMLKKIEFVCGLAYGTLSDPQMVEKTATEITSAKQRSQATVVDTQKALHDALEQLLYAMDVWATLGKLAPVGTYETGYDFDDSLIVDSEMQFAQDSRTVGLGAMPLYVFLMRNYGLTEETARQWITEKQAEQPQDMFSQERPA